MLSFLHPAELCKPAGGAGAVFARDTSFARPPCVPGAFKGHSPIKHSAAEHGRPGDSTVTMSSPAVPGPRGGCGRFPRVAPTLTRAPTRTGPVPCARLEPANAAPAKPSPLRPLPSAAVPPRCEGSGVVGCYEAGREAQSSAAGPGAGGGAGPALTRALDGARREGRRGGEGTASGRGPAGPCGRAAERLCVSLLGRASLGAGAVGPVWGGGGAGAEMAQPSPAPRSGTASGMSSN